MSPGRRPNHGSLPASVRPAPEHEDDRAEQHERLAEIAHHSNSFPCADAAPRAARPK
jgi:hypothetical protein